MMTEKNGVTELFLSAKTGAGIDLLEKHLCESVGYHPNDEGVFIARRRHLDALARARKAVASGYSCLAGMGAGELLAEELRTCSAVSWRDYRVPSVTKTYWIKSSPAFARQIMGYPLALAN